MVLATVIGKMLERVGLAVDLQILDPTTFNRKTIFGYLDQPPEHQPWDIAVVPWFDWASFPPFALYNDLALDGLYDWVTEEPELRQLYAQVLRTVEREQQQALIQQMERYTRDHAYFLFLYNPIQLFAVNNAVEFVPYVTGNLILAETSVTDQHWSVRKQKATVQE